MAIDHLGALSDAARADAVTERGVKTIWVIQ